MERRLWRKSADWRHILFRLHTTALFRLWGSDGPASPFRMFCRAPKINVNSVALAADGNRVRLRLLRPHTQGLGRGDRHGSPFFHFASGAACELPWR